MAMQAENAAQVPTFQAQVTPRDYHYMMEGFHHERARLAQYLIHADSARRHYYEWMLQYHAEMVNFHAYRMQVEHETIRQQKMLGMPLLGADLWLD